MRLQFVIADSDIKYITSLGMKFLEELGESIDMHIITEAEYYSAFFENYQHIDFLIVSESMPAIQLDKHSIGICYVLRDEQGKCSSNTDIYKYTSASLIYRKIVQENNQIESIDLESEKESKIVALYSPCGGTGKTSLALGISSYLASSYRKVLYVDAEKMNNFGYLINGCADLPISSFAMAMQSDNPYQDLKDLIANASFDYLPPTGKSLSAFGAAVDTYLNFITEAKNSGDYDIIVVDMDSSFDEYKAGILSASDDVLIVVNDNRASNQALKNLAQNMSFTKSEKFKIVCNMTDENTTEFLEGFKINAYVEWTDEMDSLSVDEIGKLSSIKRASYLFV